MITGLTALLTGFSAWAAPTDSIEKSYEKARREFYLLKSRPPAEQQYRHHWLKVIDAFVTVHKKFPKSRVADRAIFTAAELWMDLYKLSIRQADLDQALATYERLVVNFPKSNLADDALWAQVEIFAKLRWQTDSARLRAQRLVSEYGASDHAKAARHFLGEAAVAVVDVGRVKDADHTKSTHDALTRLKEDVATGPKEESAVEIAEVFSLGARPKVVLDPGHGGHDSGCRGSRGAREKDITLAVARMARDHLEKRGIDVVLTRDRDVYVPLEERTRLANEQRAQLFVSIHVNASRNSKAQGIETYYLDTSADRYAVRLAAVENDSREEDVNNMQLILADLANKNAVPASKRLAESTQEKMLQAARQAGLASPNRGTKGALFYVLVGAKMPAILVEVGFASHAQEGSLLSKTTYRNSLALAISQAIEAEMRVPPTTLVQR